MSSKAARAAPVGLRDLRPGPGRFRADLMHGLSMRPPRIPSKYFYDRRGALLFEEITGVDAYYPTRTELAILEDCMAEIARAIGPRARVVELGSGSGLKTRLLLRHLEAPASYVPVDIARAQLEELARSVAETFPALEVLPICADYTRDWSLPAPRPGVGRTVAFFPGSTIGNFERGEAQAFLRALAERCGPGGTLLLGVDLHKDSTTLEQAYNDPEGVTAKFNLNLLHRIARELGGEVDPDAFQHHAYYDEQRRRIEMRLVCERATEITLPADGAGSAAAVFSFRPGDWIHTEYSHKYAPDEMAALAESAGWRVSGLWTDPRQWFSVWLLETVT